MTDRFLTCFEEYRHLKDTLEADVTAAEKMLGHSDTPYNRRAYIRAVFTLIEGEMFQWRRLALMRHDQVQETFEERELALLREKQYRLDERGKIKNRSDYLNWPANLRFSFNMFARALGRIDELNVGVVGWEAFQEAVGIRNRITHPKHERDLEVTDQDLDHVKNAAAWYQESTRGLV